jgi:hypothetical protein
MGRPFGLNLCSKVRFNFFASDQVLLGVAVGILVLADQVSGEILIALHCIIVVQIKWGLIHPEEERNKLHSPEQNDVELILPSPVKF